MEVTDRKSQFESVRVRTTIQGNLTPQAGASFNRALRRAHLLSGLVAGVWLVVMAVTGVVINHQEALGLHNIEVSNQLLPGHYADEFHPESNPLGVVVSDLHSGRFFGPQGKLLGDAAALLLIISVLSGGLYYLRRRSR
jgi:uncharacterized iron-regulated membrane protein